ncbi:BREX-1 system adenine-specific DNA-methyltransferase PglX [Clostridium autoethanogenum]|uniref:site-specific DNA-methyltransferase (adenine-specific) n=1 Tax=Clostridium autoethanogenum TaxID=84023 RepID=A0A3M0S641_9CLOT|nr:BREX-1 system adenine-specific DNA-methyltransferase PglX [Clostridium autoethanogenum]RMC93040.1 BREX-1 system adenine-specific DNA-methyltransferase PglX [Clostridium autoethanogenum]
MDKTAIKNFAVEARNMLRDSAISQAGLYGITDDGCAEPIQTGNGFEVYKTIAGTDNRIFGDTIKKRASLVKAIDEKGFDNVIEEVAYTWFNRLIAIRFMEVNDYLPTRVRVLSSETSDKKEPDIVTQSLDIDLTMSQEELVEVQKAKDENRYDDAFGLLFIKQCNELNAILPGLFEKTDDYMELLLKLSYTNDGVVRMLVDTVPEENFDVEKEGQVEIIGWLYQYYNTELKDETFALLKKNVKITRERIPAATQLFTPDWIVRYMVENSLGRLWIEHLRANDPSLDEKELAEEFGWKYYLPEAKQEDSVNAKLAEIRTSYKDMTPMDIKCIDPCMGSGHILVYMFDVLMDIYRSAGYSERDAVFYILENNIRGLDIDQRAYQLSYFALMMKGREYNRRFFAGREVEQGGRSWRKYSSPNVRAIKESNVLPSNLVNQINENFAGVFNDNELKCIQYVTDLFKDAKEYGSIINVDSYCNPEREDRQYASVAFKLYSFINGDSEYFRNHDMNLMHHMIIQEYFPLLDELIQQANVMCEKYDVVTTNPPYMGSSGMENKLGTFIKNNYPKYKSDLFAVFIKKVLILTKTDGYYSLITQHAWMFLSSYEILRNELLLQKIENLVHLGSRAFDEIGGEVVQTVAFCSKKHDNIGSKTSFVRLVDYCGEKEKKDEYLRKDNIYNINSDCFSQIPGSPISYWIDKKFYDIYKNSQIYSNYFYSFQGMITGNNNYYLRFWYEIDINKALLQCTNPNEIMDKEAWVPYNKGGKFRKWYGNNDYLLRWEKEGKELTRARTENKDYYFRKGVTWSFLTTGNFSCRYFDNGFLWDVSGTSIFTNSNIPTEVLCANMNSKVQNYILHICNPTLNYQVENILALPYIEGKEDKIKVLAEKCIKISKEDWDSFETSWDFKKHVLI